MGDNFVRLINPTAANGNLCAMIYVFDDDQEPGECCGCSLSPNKLLTLSVINQLTSNWEVTSNDFESGVVKIVSAVPNGGASPAAHGGCDPSIAYTQTPALVGSISDQRGSGVSRALPRPTCLNRVRRTQQKLRT